MNEKEAIEVIKNIDVDYSRCKKCVLDNETSCIKDGMDCQLIAINTVLQLLDQKDKRIDELEKALVEEAIKSKVLELYNQRINKLKDKLKKDIKNNKSGINLMDLRCIGKWQEAKEILKILEE